MIHGRDRWRRCADPARDAMVVHGLDGMDEISTTAGSVIARVGPAGATTQTFDAAALGVPRARIEQLTANSLDRAAEFIRRVLAGEPGPAREIVEVNAAAALMVGGAAGEWRGALDAARHAIDSGAAQRVLAELVRCSRGGGG